MSKKNVCCDWSKQIVQSFRQLTGLSKKKTKTNNWWLDKYNWCIEYYVHILINCTVQIDPARNNYHNETFRHWRPRFPIDKLTTDILTFGTPEFKIWSTVFFFWFSSWKRKEEETRKERNSRLRDIYRLVQFVDISLHRNLYRSARVCCTSVRYAKASKAFNLVRMERDFAAF